MKKTIVFFTLFAIFSIMGYSQQYKCTILPKDETVQVFDMRGNSILTYSKNTIKYQNIDFEILKKGNQTILSNSNQGETTGTCSKKFKKITLQDGITYTLKSGKKKLSYTKPDKEVIANANYSFNKEKIEIEMNSSDHEFIPFLLLSTLTHIKGTQESENIVNNFIWMYSIGL